MIKSWLEWCLKERNANSTKSIPVYDLEKQFSVDEKKGGKKIMH